MKIIDRYIGHAVLSATLTVLLVLLAIFTFFAFIEELETIGIGSYGVVEVAVVVSLGVPRLAYDLFPIAALIGALLALGGLMEEQRNSHRALCWRLENADDVVGDEGGVRVRILRHRHRRIDISAGRKARARTAVDGGE